MYGKHFASMYSGSMIGAGAIVFAVMGYVISHMRPDKLVGMSVELNPKLLGPILGESDSDVSKAIEFLCSPDKESRSKEEGGKRLLRLGQFDYRVVNGVKYREIRDEEERRRQNRDAQQRARDRKHSKPQSGEAKYVKALENGASDEQLGKLADPERLK